MDLLPDEFLLWYLLFMDEEGFECPHCGHELSREELDENFSKEEGSIACPFCSEKIKEQDFE